MVVNNLLGIALSGIMFLQSPQSQSVLPLKTERLPEAVTQIAERDFVVDDKAYLFGVAPLGLIDSGAYYIPPEAELFYRYPNSPEELYGVPTYYGMVLGSLERIYDIETASTIAKIMVKRDVIVARRSSFDNDIWNHEKMHRNYSFGLLEEERKAMESEYERLIDEGRLMYGCEHLQHYLIDWCNGEISYSNPVTNPYRDVLEEHFCER